MLTEIQIAKGKHKKNQKSLVNTLLELILIKQISMIMKNLVEHKYITKSTKKLMVAFTSDAKNEI